MTGVAGPRAARVGIGMVRNAHPGIKNGAILHTIRSQPESTLHSRKDSGLILDTDPYRYMSVIRSLDRFPFLWTGTIFDFLFVIARNSVVAIYRGFFRNAIDFTRPFSRNLRIHMKGDHVKKKVSKGLLAAVAAVLLLLGGLGTFALWSDSETTDSGDVQTGTLDLSAVNSGQWRDISTPASPVTIDPATFRMVPGDVLQYTASYRVEAVGDNLTARITTTNQGTNVIPAALTNWVTVTNTATFGGAPIPSSVITSADSGKTVDVTVTVTFNQATPDQVGINSTINLSQLQVTLQQERA
ncbi:alternate-type signal peptide domain-containing protein [Gordonia sp. 'Campus']|uniref:alternate-type signal peptide domain-containing protein n=1 Tax=Gordonia sp. 'Campus' TaxID=2915824 RepID=UPI001EE42C9C|nr:alternate-type signal peptide domain-containing protein [Gordonia sp. 'Campus']